MPMHNSINTETTQRMPNELEKGRAVWKTVKRVQTKVMNVDNWMRSMVRPAESDESCNLPIFGLLKEAHQ